MRRLFFILTLFFISILAFGKNMKIIYPRFQSKEDTRFLENVELLEIALQKTEKEYGPYTLTQSKILMNELRYLQDVKSAKNCNVIWYGTNDKLEKELIPIRIPIGKGILGYRIFLINRDNQANFEKIKNLEDLKKYKVGQGLDWADVKVFKDNKIPIETGTNYEGLFDMLKTKKFDYFSRGINEAYNEYESRKKKYPKMMVEENILLYYPWPYYFFVSPKTPEIAERLEKGLNLMVKDGTFDKIFYKYNGENIKKANLKNRTVIKIENRFLPSKTPLDKKELWFYP